ncbi:ribosomal RNA large subunit methyltransferase J domain containing protein, putative [Babesia bigemina]|uniref:Cap-specific mRNA (nucleoside-2'-O-)-methyltransferase 2 n=1 Tax=Babesia bigemina TaxID=5866 RepID=A0A061D4B9_BABBI|nr:ribosomal RNA large subunit methyltransferase J domain containing protein, putative [Babesia bigemina]CDR95586.1 ribosomal RNA large subunit methyltransferase J domain containing protein, putative [Babesia bigemina]|eukprot:XP_012767772.1 ribosomal RNA large subunit methyltransferase J domain containing protein, putative [Babesia bigemina]
MATAATEKTPALHNEKRFVFQGSLNRLLADAKRVPPSATPCQKCVQRKRVCICETVTSAVGRAPAYEIAELAETRTMLSELRDSLNGVDIEKWSVHTRLLDQTSLVAKQVSEITTVVNGRREPGVELVTNAWLKLYDILQTYKVLDAVKPDLDTEGGVVRSFHISECPGGFIAALNHAIKQRNSLAELAWQAISLNPYHEGNSHGKCLAEDILFRETARNWLNGADDSGNVTRTLNIEYIWDRISRPSRFNKGRSPVLVDIVTADGSFDCQADPNNQEALTAPLKLAEVVCALGLMRVGAIFVLKMFTLFEESSLSIMALLNMCFKTVEVYKPHMSKANSSEVYVVCMHFNGITSVLLCALCKIVSEYAANHHRRAILPREWVPSSFRTEFVECATMFAQLQCRSLRSAMAQFLQVTDENAFYKRKREFARLFISQFKISAIPSDCRLVKYISFSENTITGKDTSSLLHVPKRILPDLDTRRNYVKCYKDLQARRVELHRQYAQKEDPSHFITLGEEATSAEFGRDIADALRFANEFKPPYPQLNDGTLMLDLDERLLSELRADMLNQRYLKDSWFVAAPLQAHEVRMSHFVCNDLLYDVSRMRTLCGARAPIVTAMDALCVDGAVGEALSDINMLPNGGMVDLAVISQCFLDINRYKAYLEITCNAGQQFPAVSLLKRHGIPGSIIYGFKANGDASSHIQFDSSYELQVIVESFLGEGTVNQCIDFKYDECLTRGEGHRCLTAQLQESPIRNSCDFVFCDTTNSSVHHREVCMDEFKSKPVIVAQLVQALYCLSPDGDLVVSVRTIITRFSVCLVTVLRTVFDEVHLYRPDSVAPWTQRCYIICKRYNDREKNHCRYYLQCLWDAICLHKKAGKEVVQTLRPHHFTYFARKLWEFNTRLFLSELDDIAAHSKGESLKADRKNVAVQLLQNLGVVDILYPPRLLQAQGPCRLPLFQNVSVVNIQLVSTNYIG